MRLAAARLRQRLGRRGAFLGGMGTLWLLYGYGLLVEPIASTASYRLLLHVMPMDGWAVAWVVAGVVALLCAWTRPPWDWPGFAALYATAIPWGLSSLMSWWPLDDNPRGWIGAAIWGALGGAIWVVVGWPEPPRGERGGRDAER
ncbi:hypothetical protein ACFRCG_41925 [Embleya sp. NPDC056575]|uniref:hypothetical protein n=1 Tax=unclassified Embleya TaxID=2699296 RepID=UPI0036ACD0ED